MWSDLNVAETTLDCTPPFSFYFDLVGSVWKAALSNNLPLHRLCTLARKQGATFVLIESALSRPVVRSEIDDLDAANGGGGAAEAIAISFFASAGRPDAIAEVDEGEFLGQAVVINYRPPGSPDFSHSYIFEAIVPPPSLSGGSSGTKLLLNNYISGQKQFDCIVRGRVFRVDGIYYCQQNASTHVCAHASLRMAIGPNKNEEFTSGYINKLLGVKPPCGGLQLGQIVAVLKDQGFDADVVDCSKLERETYISILASIVESGDQALLVFKTGLQSGGVSQEHVVLVFGHTRNADEWHPQAIPAYAGPGSAKYLPAANWIDHFLIHDDNLGPYYTLSSHSLEFDPDVAAHWIVAIRDKTPNFTPHGAEALAAVVLSNFLPLVASLGNERWFQYITRKIWRYVLRTILITRADYFSHVLGSTGHDGSKAQSSDLAVLQNLPERFWMVEFTLPALFTGNRAKLGEVLIHSDPSGPVTDLNEVVLGMRMPALLVVRGVGGSFVHSPCSLHSHSRVYRKSAYGQEW
jgi:hypothetical protein